MITHRAAITMLCTFQMPKEYLLTFFILMQLLLLSTSFASCINKQQSNWYVDEDG